MSWAEPGRRVGHKKLRGGEGGRRRRWGVNFREAATEKGWVGGEI